MVHQRTSNPTRCFIGAYFGRLVVIGENGETCSRRRVEVLCVCGQRKWVRPGCLLRGVTCSCGCLKREESRKRKTIHGAFGTRLYKCWAGMLERCHNQKRPDFKNYGGRGISVCKSWRQFESFRDWSLTHGYRDNLTLDRKKTNGNYCPSNCRWATRKQQAQSGRKRINSRTPFIGVSWHKYRQQWETRVQGDGRHLGYFDDPFSAAWVRDAYVKQHYDKYATLNNLKDRRKHKKQVKIERRGTFDWKKVLSK